MHSRAAPINGFVSLIIALLLHLPGCAGGAAWLRRHTYPPTFHYITEEQLRSTMWQLAYHSRGLRELMARPEKTEYDRSASREHLEAMEQAAVNLNRTGWPSNHPLVDANQADFVRDIKLARQALSRDPPNYLLAASLSGACVYCHGGR
jgi:hypothetical protein